MDPRETWMAVQWAGWGLALGAIILNEMTTHTPQWLSKLLAVAVFAGLALGIAGCGMESHYEKKAKEARTR
jgi:thiol:disulfide interchange protein